MEMTRGKQWALLTMATCAATMAIGGVANAATPYFVTTTGDDGNDCLSMQTACLSVGGALGKTASGDTINVAPGTYMGGTPIPVGHNVTVQGTSAATPPVLDSIGPDVMTVGAASLTLADIKLQTPVAGANSALNIDNGGTVTAHHVTLRGGTAGGTTVTLGVTGTNALDADDGSDFVGAPGSNGDIGVLSFGTTNHVSISGSTLSDYQQAIYTSGGSTDLLGDQVTDARDLLNGIASSAVNITGAATIKDTTITQAAGAASDNGSIGIQVVSGSAQMARNKIVGLTGRTGLYLSGLTSAFLFSDVIAGNDVGLSTAGDGFVNLTNVTVAGNTVFNAQLTSSNVGIDSTLIGDPGSLNDLLNGTTTCIGSNSRVPAGAPWDACTGGPFTSAAPLLGGAGGWHLQTGSPMIDAGGSALVDPDNQTDADGDLRHVPGPDAVTCAAPVRDIGADEYTPSRDCIPPVVHVAGTVSGTSATFTYGADEASNFQCALDGAAPGPCGGPGTSASRTINNLARGSHVFVVVGNDIRGNVAPPQSARVEISAKSAGLPGSAKKCKKKKKAKKKIASSAKKKSCKKKKKK
jgi:hypothetical protein